MLITDISSIPQLPSPALGLLPAIHDATVTNVASASDLPPIAAAAGNIYRNSGTSPITLPAGGGFPSRNVLPNEYFSSNGVGFYKLLRKDGFSRQVSGLSSSTFTTPVPHGMVDGIALKFAGWSDPTGFANNTLYYVVNSTASSFQIAATSGGSPLVASTTGVVGWLHTQTTNSFYPADFNRSVFVYPFTQESLPVGASFYFQREFSFRSMGAVTTAVWSVIFEFGERVDDAAPAPVGPNIAGYNWLPPALEQQIVITDLATTHDLGLKITRMADGFSGQRYLYSKALNIIPGTMPTSSDFLFRVRIGQFDTEDNVDLRGFVAYFIKQLTT